jgi:sporulation protein YtfJ
MMDISVLVTSILEQIKQTVRSETVIGQPVQAEDSIIIPVSRVSFGFGVGGGSGDSQDPKKGGGAGAGGGATIEPVAFVVVSKGKAQILPLKSREATITHIIDLIPTLLEFVKDMQNKDKQKDGGNASSGSGECV